MFDKKKYIWSIAVAIERKEKIDLYDRSYCSTENKIIYLEQFIYSLIWHNIK